MPVWVEPVLGSDKVSFSGTQQSESTDGPQSNARPSGPVELTIVPNYLKLIE